MRFAFNVLTSSGDNTDERMASENQQEFNDFEAPVLTNKDSQKKDQEGFIPHANETLSLSIEKHNEQFHSISFQRLVIDMQTNYCSLRNEGENANKNYELSQNEEENFIFKINISMEKGSSKTQNQACENEDDDVLSSESRLDTSAQLIDTNIAESAKVIESQLATEGLYQSEMGQAVYYHTMRSVTPFCVEPEISQLCPEISFADQKIDLEQIAVDEQENLLKSTDSDKILLNLEPNPASKPTEIKDSNPSTATDERLQQYEEMNDDIGQNQQIFNGPVGHMSFSEENQSTNPVGWKLNQHFMPNSFLGKITEESRISGQSFSHSLNCFGNITEGMFSYDHFSETFKQTKEANDDNTKPLDQCLQSENATIRAHAYEELARLLECADKKDEFFSQSYPEFINFIAETDPIVQEKSLLAFKIYIMNIKSLKIDAKEATKTLIERALGPANSAVESLANEILCLFFEKCEKKALFDGINESISSKNQKTSLAGVKAVLELLKNYGSRKLDSLRPFVPSIEKLAGSSISALRNEAMNFYKEALKWMGDGAKHYLVKLKKQQIEELEKFYNDWPKRSMRPIRGDVQAPSGKLNQGINKNIISGILGGGQSKSIEPIDITQKFNNAWCDRLLSQQKWSDKKQMLDELLKSVNVPKLAAVKYDHIEQLLKRLLNDSNLTISLTAMKIYGLMARGLRKKFKETARSISPLLLQKLSDKKSQVVEEVYRTFDMLYYSISLEEISDQIQDALGDNNQRSKLNILGLIERYLDRENLDKSERCWKFFEKFCEKIKKFVNDADESLWSTTLTLIEKVHAVFGKEAIGGGGGSGNKKTDQVENSGERRESFPLHMPPLSHSQSPLLKEYISFQKKHASQPSLQNVTTASNVARKGSVKISVYRDHQEGVSEEVENSGMLSASEAESKLVGLGVHDAIFKGLNSSDWKERQMSLGLLGQWINENKAAIADFPDVVIRFLKAKLKDWKEPNLGICKENFAILNLLCSAKETKLNKRAFTYISNLLINNCCDMKFKDAIYTITRSFVQKISPKFVINSILKIARSPKAANRNPQINAEICTILTNLITELPVEVVPVKEVIAYAKVVIQDINSQCKNAATGLFKALYSQIGYPIFNEIQDLPADLLMQLQTELEKAPCASENDQHFKLQLKGGLAESRNISRKSSANTIGESSLSKVPEKIVKCLTNPDWKIRKEGLEQLEQLLSNHKTKISGDVFQELVSVLKARLEDPNKALLKGFIQLIKKLSTEFGKEISQHSRPLIESLTNKLAHKHTEVRQEALACLEAIGSKIGMDQVISSILSLLLRGSSEVRANVINLALKYPYELPKVDLQHNVNALICSLQDRDKGVRKNAEKLIERSIEIIGIEPFWDALKPFSLSIQKELKSIFDKYLIRVGDAEKKGNEKLSKSPYESAEKKTPSRSPSFSSKSPSRKPSSQTRLDIVLEKLTPSKRLQESNHTSNQKTSTPNRQTINEEMKLKKNTPIKLDPHQIITATGQKGSRIEEEKKLKWNTSEVQEELVVRLKEHLACSLSAELISKMFSGDYRKHIDIVEIFKKALNDELLATIDILDLIVRWIFLRMFENSTIQTLKGMIDYICCLIDKLESASYTLHPFEGDVLVSVLIERFNVANSGIRSTLKTVIVKLCSAYPPSSIVPHLLRALNSKSFKKCVDCLETIAEIAKKYGTKAFSAKDIKYLGKLLSHKNMSIKTAVIAVLVELGRIPDYDVFQHLTEAPNRLLEQLRSKIQGDTAGNSEPEEMKQDSFEGQGSSTVSLLYPESLEQSPHSKTATHREETPTHKDSLISHPKDLSLQNSEKVKKQVHFAENVAQLVVTIFFIFTENNRKFSRKVRLQRKKIFRMLCMC